MSQGSEKPRSSAAGTKTGPASLSSLCRAVVVSNLERYPPDSFGILDELEWESIIRLKHKRTRPQKGKGGLDGTGRMNPAVGEKFLSEVEEVMPHLSQSQVVDRLVWKDIVEYRFRAGGLSRPKGLLFPWPVLESKAAEDGKFLVQVSKLDSIDNDTKNECFEAITRICSLPMDVGLLKSSEIGKSVKKFLKAVANKDELRTLTEYGQHLSAKATPVGKLESTLNAWMVLAEKNGVIMKDETASPRGPTEDFGGRDLKKARECNSWRELYYTLRAGDEDRRNNQGAKMRERRKKLDSVRPKIVKVRHATTSRQQSILNGMGSAGAASSSASNKIQQLRMEAKVISSRRGQANIAAAAAKKSVGGFAAAVAFATSGSKSNKRKLTKTTTVQLAGGKRMKVPDAKRASGKIKQRLEILKRGQKRR